MFVPDSLTNLTITPIDCDIYKIPVDSNSQTTITFEPKDFYTDEYISFTLYNNHILTLKEEYIPLTSPASISFFSKVVDTFYIRIVKSLDETTSSPKYNLYLTKKNIKVDDISEPNNSKLTACTLTNSTIAFLSGISDTDYYKITLAPKEYMKLTVISDSANINTITSSLVRSDSVQPGTAIGNSTSYSYYTSHGDTCYLKIIFPNSYNSPNNPLRYSLELVKTLLANDTFEANDTKITSKPIGSGFYDSLQIVGTDNDYYKLLFDTTMYVEAILRIIPKYLNTSDFRMNLETLSSSVLTANNNRSDSLKFSYIANAKDSMYCHIYNTSTASSFSVSFYSLELRATPINRFDPFEPNNTAYTATLISTSAVQSVLFGQSDTDYYRIPLKKGDNAQIKVSSDSIDGTGIKTDVQLSNMSYIYGPVSTYASSYNYYSSFDDTLILKVSRQVNLSNNFQLKYLISINRTILPEDRYEPNNSKENATLLKTGISDSLYSNSDNIDYYMFTSDTAVILDATLKTPAIMSYSSFLRLFVNSRWTSVSHMSGESKDNMNISYYVAPGDTVFFVITGDYATVYIPHSIKYSLTLSTKSIKEIDNLEPNNSRSTATLLENNSQVISTIYSSNDTDYYKLPVSAGLYYSIEATGDKAKSIDVDFNLTDFLNKYNLSSRSYSEPAIFSCHITENDTIYMKVSHPSSIILNTSCSYKLAIKQTVSVGDIFPGSINPIR